MQSKQVISFALSVAMALALSPAPASAQEAAPPPLSSEQMPLATTRSLILDITEAASRAVAVGERGEVLVSESRTDWRQVDNVPTRATLTAVSAVGDLVWAVGHDGTIIHSTDGGLTWSSQRVDVLDTSPDAVFDPRQGMPLLDVLMLSPTHGFAIGAYSQLLRTDDAGATWTFIETKAAAAEDAVDEAANTSAEAGESEVGNEDSWTFSEDDLAMDDIAEPHMNAIARTGSGAFMIVGERGTAFRSRDAGVTWERIKLPYGGSMFGVLGYEGEHVLAFGMRGNVFESHDLGTTWEQVDSGTELGLMAGAVYGEGGFALVGANGIVLVRNDATAAPQTRIYTNSHQETPVLAAVLALSNRSLVVAGEKGVDGYTPSSAGKGE
ncbi:MAG TPA: hypothetical protein VFN29_01045 [Chiayiivirga sp.]|nr:hypothetical protein [Chiayiivirga sp.]